MNNAVVMDRGYAPRLPRVGTNGPDSTNERPQMVITGERTVPGIWHENYWVRRHEVVYELVAGLVGGLEVLEAGCGEGYGADLLAATGARVLALEDDDMVCRHAASAYDTFAGSKTMRTASVWPVRPLHTSSYVGCGVVPPA